MLYPEFIKKGQTIGICAPSAGAGHKLDSLKESNRVLRAKGYKVKESASVRKNGVRSASGKKRGKELNELISDKKVKTVIAAKGGNYMLEMLPYIDFDNIKNNPKWLCGMSDPTNMLFTCTTKCDIATLYGFNGAGFTMKSNKPQTMFFNYLKGNIKTQNSYKYYQIFIETINDVKTYKQEVKWISKNPVNITGRMIGGCIEVIEKIIGSEYDSTNEFIERYKDDGIIWYFDVFDMSSLNFYLTLLQFKNAGWFKYCKGVLIGRVAFPNVEDKRLDYIKAADKALGKIPHICEMDIGHTRPSMVMINGAMASVKCRNGKGSISFKLK